MADQGLQGALYLIPRPGEPAQSLPFRSLQELLDLCTRHQGSGAFVRVELFGDSGGQSRRLVLDFGQFSTWPE